MKPNRKILQAFTLAECLVVIIIGGIVFLGISEGFGIFTKYSLQRSQSMEEQLQEYHDLILLSGIMKECDSLKYENNQVAIYHNGIETRLVQAEEKLIVKKGLYTDTLFSTRHTSLQVLDSLSREGLLPSFKVTFHDSGEDILKHIFSPEFSQHMVRQNNIEEMEKDYLYE